MCQVRILEGRTPRCGIAPWSTGMTFATFLPSRVGARSEPPPSASEIGRASCRERVCQYVEISVVAVSLKKNPHSATRQLDTRFLQMYECRLTPSNTIQTFRV